jgi:putative tricarboxylic transport membrane protein
MKIGNLIIAFSLEGLGIFLIIESYKLRLQTFSDPGAGLFPFLLGILLCLLTIPLCISSIASLMKVEKGKEKKELEYLPNLKEIGVAFTCLVGYMLLLEKLGFLITSFLFLFVLFLIGNPRRRLFIFLFSVLVTFGAYLIFSILLQVPFPSGFLR